MTTRLGLVSVKTWMCSLRASPIPKPRWASKSPALTTWIRLGSAKARLAGPYVLWPDWSCPVAPENRTSSRAFPVTRIGRPLASPMTLRTYRTVRWAGSGPRNWKTSRSKPG